MSGNHDRLVSVARFLNWIRPCYKTLLAISAVALVFGFAQPSLAASLTWDASTTQPASPTDGSGNWSTSSANWSNGTSDNPWNNANADTAVIGNGGTPGTITVQPAGVTVGGINLDPVTGTSGYQFTGGPITLSGTAVISGNDGTTSGANFGVNVTGAGSLTVGGTSPVTFSGPGLSDYAGPTTVNGTLLNNTTISNSTVTVNSGGVAGGSGTYGGNVTVSSGGTFAPGGAVNGGVATMTTLENNLTLSSGAQVNYLLNDASSSGTAGGNDAAAVSGTLTINPDLTINVDPGEDFTYGNYALASYGTLTDSSSAFNGWSVTGLAPGTGISYSTAGGDLTLSLTAPPAPTAPQSPVYTPPVETPTPDMHPANHFAGYNENCTNTTGTSETTVNVVLNGNFSQAGDVVNNYPTFGPGTTSTVTYNAANNTTTITVTNTTVNAVPVPAGKVAHIGYSLLNGTGGGEMESPETAYKYWGTPQNATPASNLRLPAPSWFVTNPGQGPNTVFVIMYATIELANGATSGEWDEQQVPANQPFKINLGNDDMLDGNMFAFNVGFQFSNTEIPLDDLNLNDYPPSSFQPLPGFMNGQGIGPGMNLESSMLAAPELPEPSSLGLLAIGAAGLLARRRNARAAS